MSREDSSFKKLLVWQKSVALASQIYRVTADFPQAERFGLSSQMQRASVSIASNIAEGSGRASKKEFIQFLHIAQGSACELETQLEVALSVGFLTEGSHQKLTDLVIEIKMMLTSLARSLVR